MIENGERSFPCIDPSRGVPVAVDNVTYAWINLHLTRRMKSLEKALQLVSLAHRYTLVCVALQDEDGRHAGHVLGEIIAQAAIILAYRFDSPILGRFFQRETRTEGKPHRSDTLGIHFWVPGYESDGVVDCGKPQFLLGAVEVTEFLFARPVEIVDQKSGITVLGQVGSIVAVPRRTQRHPQPSIENQNCRVPSRRWWVKDFHSNGLSATLECRCRGGGRLGGRDDRQERGHEQ